MRLFLCFCLFVVIPSNNATTATPKVFKRSYYPVYTTLVDTDNIPDNVAVDTKTLASIVTDIDSHYDHLLTNYQNNSVDSLGGHSETDGGSGWVWGDPKDTVHNHVGVDNGVEVDHNHVDNVGWTEELHPFENSVSVEGSSLKVALVLLSLWYLVIAVLASGSNLFAGSCAVGHPPLGDGEMQLIDANGVPQILEPHPMQSEITNMFLSPSSSYGSSEEEEPLPMDLLSQATEICPQSAFFYGQNAGYMNAAMMVKNMFMQVPSSYQMLDMAMKIRPMLNPKLWYTALMHACSSRGDMGGMPLPTAVDAMPDSFISGIVEQHQGRRDHDDECIKLDGNVGKDNGVENKLWYFREDVMVNSHHWYWHLSWPLMTRGGGLMDRRGELFYFAHRSMLYRYNIERITNGLDIAEPLDYKAPVLPGYNPHLTECSSGQNWTPREQITFLSDIQHQNNPTDRITIRIGEWLGSKRRLLQAIDSGEFVTPPGKGKTILKNTLPIPEKTGIDMLGNTLEAVDISINPMYYGREGFHNNGHRVLGYIQDPEFEKMLPPGVMAEPATAMRDPIFYRFHTNVNDMFERYKATLPPYDHSSLTWPGVSLKSIRVVSKSGSVNQLKTFFRKREFPLHMGLAFNRTNDGHADEEVQVCAKHLDHEEFQFVFDVYRAPCAKSKSNSATFRVFLAPKFDQHGRRLSMHEQRQLFVHLDLFNVKLPIGWSQVTRSSLASSLTIPYQQTLAQVNSKDPARQPNCGCGWPHHLLLPKGTKKGTDYDLFVMMTNGDDYIHPRSNTCSKAFIYCGIGREKYPDSRPMGFPFDRPVIVGSGGCGKIGGVWGKVCKVLLGGGGGRKIGHVEEFVGYGGGSMGLADVVIVHKKK